MRTRSKIELKGRLAAASYGGLLPTASGIAADRSRNADATGPAVAHRYIRATVVLALNVLCLGRTRVGVWTTEAARRRLAARPVGIRSAATRAQPDRYHDRYMLVTLHRSDIIDIPNAVEAICHASYMRARTHAMLSLTGNRQAVSAVVCRVRSIAIVSISLLRSIILYVKLRS